MITVHHLDDSRSQRVLWLLEELGVDYRIERYARDKANRLAPASLKKIHPLGKSPVVEDDGLIIAETGAIVEYLIERYGEGRFAPARTSPDHLKYRYWMHFAEGSAMPQLLLKLFFTRIKETKMPFFAKPIANSIADRVLADYVDPNLADQMSFVDAELAASTWFVGEDLTGADVMMIFPLEAGGDRVAGGGRYRNVQAFVERAHSRPAYQRALEKGGPYAYA